MNASRLLVSLALAGFSGAAIAHSGHESASFSSGFGHPFGGIDHLLAMLAVGAYAARQHGRARWALPPGFVAAMLVGAGAGAAGVALPGVESGIAVSVLALGLLIATAVRLPLGIGLPLLGAFAVFHGHAHHAGIGDAELAPYAGGFAVATALLHWIGFFVGRWSPGTRVAAGLRRAAGGLMALVGALLLAG